MSKPAVTDDVLSTGCKMCREGRTLGFEFTFAFQPIVDLAKGKVFAYEALVRGMNSQGAGEILSRLGPDDLYTFDQAARVKAVELASRLMPGEGPLLSINVIPNAVYDPVRCLRTTLRAARTCNFPVDRIMFEMTEHEAVSDVAHLKRIVDHYATAGFVTAIDDFGAGYSGPGLLADFKPHLLKIDMGLVRNIDGDASRRIIVGGMVDTARALGIDVIAEGVESEGECAVLCDLGVRLFQGYLFARPGFETLPEPTAPATIRVTASPPDSADCTASRDALQFAM